MFPNVSDRGKIVLQLIFVVALCAGVVTLLIYTGTMKPRAKSHRVEFRVEAVGGFAIITLEAGKTSISKPTTVSVPWTKTLRISSGTEVYLTASNPTQTGQLICTISLDAVQWKTDSTSAPKDGVACAGIVP